jgi:hypothetical protein
MSYTLGVLNSITVEQHGVLLNVPNTLCKTSRIGYACRCGQLSEKTFDSLKRSGMLCLNCKRESTIQKRRTTNQHRYGIPSPPH